MDDSSTRPVNSQNKCPNCGRQNRLEATRCWWCGTPLAVDPSVQATLPFDVQGQYAQPQQPGPTQPYTPYSQQPQYSPSAPTQRVGPPYPQQQQQSHSYSQQGQYAQPATQAAPQYYPPAQVNVNRGRPMWLWLLAALLGLVLLGGVGYALFGPKLPVVVGPAPTSTPQGAVITTTTSTPQRATETPAPVTETPSPTAAATDTPVIVPTVTPELPTDTPEPLPTDTPVPPADTPVPEPPTETPVPPPSGDYTATAAADPSQPKTPNGGVRITGTLYRGGQPVEGAAMRVTLHYPNRDDVIDGVSTGPDGSARVSFKIGKTESGVQVDVDVAFFVDGQEVVAAQTSFTPKGK